MVFYFSIKALVSAINLETVVNEHVDLKIYRIVFV